jgi:hypothetical protein
MATLNRKDLRTTTCAMQHRHFATIAAIIRDFEVTSRDGYEKHRLASHFAQHLAATNPNFSTSRFLAACKGEE